MGQITYGRTKTGKPLLVVRDLPLEANETVKNLGGRWRSGERAWVLPASPIMAQSLTDALWGHAQASETVARLAARAEGMKQAAWAKVAPIEQLPQPKYRRFDAWEHQLRAFHFAMALPNSMLNMAMGTGKTKVTIDTIMNRAHRRVLVLSPHSAIEDVWEQQIPQHWSPDLAPPLVLPLNTGTVAKKRDRAEQALAIGGGNGQTVICVINYESAWREPWAEWSKTAEWDLLVLDESHKTKNPKAATTKYAIDLGDLVPSVMLLSGTPLAHSPMDAWSQFRVMDPGVFGDSFYRYQMRYGVKGGFQGRQIVNYQNLPELSDKLYRLAFRVEADVLDLPPVMDERITIELEPEARQVYSRLESDFYAAVGRGEITVNNALTQLLRLQQITGGWAQLDDEDEPRRISTAKADALVELLEGIDPDEPVVVFSRFAADLDATHAAAAKNDRLSWELSGRRRELADWKAYNGGGVIAVQIQAGGAGIDLSRASYGVYYSVGFSLADYEQSRARLHRPGQKQHVRYYHLVAKGTVDSRVYTALRRRKRVIDAVIEREDT